VLSDLEREAYQVQPFLIPACALNAPHRRDRVWIVANSIGNGWGDPKGISSSDTTDMGQHIKSSPENRHAPDTEGMRCGGGISCERGTRWDEVFPKEQKGCKVGMQAEGCLGLTNATNPKGKGLEGENTEGNSRAGRRTSEHPWSEPWLEVATRLCRVDDGLPRQVDRVNRLKALGNAIVPQVAAEIFRAMKAVDRDYGHSL
jgi:DNA (cytosine-5)-methyltransferase 1